MNKVSGNNFPTNSNRSSISLLNPLIVALDVDSSVRAMDLAHELKDIVGAFKIGPRLAYRFGGDFVQKISAIAPVFLDCKYFDIPSTMEASIRSAFESGATFVSVHALVGEEALRRISILEEELNKIRPFKVLCVTILTSWNEGSLPSNFTHQSISDHVLSLAKLVQNVGLSGLVCSPYELDVLRELSLYCVTPGVRFDDEDKGDQMRVMTPGKAMSLGASALVVGRPIISSRNPREIALDYSVKLYGA